MKLETEVLRLRIFSVAAIVMVLLVGVFSGRLDGQAGALSSEGEAVSADVFPSKPIKVYVGYSPGGRTDTVARMLAKKINEDNLLPQPLIVVNKPGAAGATAARDVMAADPDGYTIMHWSHAMLVSNAMELNTINPNDFHTLGYAGGGSPVWAVKDSSPFKTMDDLISHLKANPKSLVEAVGIGTTPHLVGLQFASEAGFETRLVGAPGGADRLARILGGNADIAMFSAQEFVKYEPNGLRALVSFGEERLNVLPDVPTAKELGYDVVWSNPNWWLAPKGTDPEAASRLAQALETALASDELQEWYTARSLSPYWMGREDAHTDSMQVLKRLQAVIQDYRQRQATRSSGSDS